MTSGWLPAGEIAAILTTCPVQSSPWEQPRPSLVLSNEDDIFVSSLPETCCLEERVFVL